MFNPYGITDIFLDLDEVLVDLEGALQKLNNSFESDLILAEIKGNKNEVFFKHLISSIDKKVFEISEPTDLYKILVTTPYQSYSSILDYWRNNGIKLHILSSVTSQLTNQHSNISTQKYHWLQKYNLLENLSIHLVKGAYLKQQYASSTSLLLDDYTPNCEQFRKAGGMAIQVKSKNEEDVLKQLHLLGLLDNLIHF